MTLLIAGIIIFFGVHLLPILAGLRSTMINRFGEAIYKTTFALISAIGFVMMLMGKGRVEFTPIFSPPEWASTIALVAMLPAFVLLMAAYYPCRIKTLAGHPMLLAIVLWSGTHLLANGDLGSILLFGSFLGYGIIDWLFTPDSTAPKVADSPRLIADLAVIAVGVGVYFFVLKIHPAIFAPIY